MKGLEEWDYGSGENLNVTIEGRKIILTESVTVAHLAIRNGGVLVFGKAAEKPTKPKTDSITIGVPVNPGKASLFFADLTKQ